MKINNKIRHSSFIDIYYYVYIYYNGKIDPQIRGCILYPHLRNDRSMIGYNGPVELWYFFIAQDRLLAF